MTEPIKPLADQQALDRKTVAKYFNRVGRGLNCRLDVPVLVLDDVRWASKIFADLSAQLTQIGWEDKRPEIMRVLEARYAMEAAKRELQARNERKIGQAEFRKLRSK